MKVKHLGEIEPIFVKNKSDVFEAANLLRRVGVKVFKDANSELNFTEKGDDVKNNYLVCDDDGWRIQSHYIGDGISVVELNNLIWNTLPPDKPKKLKNKFKEGDKVYKPKGYKFNGIVVSVFKTTSGDVRIVAEMEDNGMLHIFSEKQLELRKDCEHDLMKGTLDGYYVSICKKCNELIRHGELD